MSKVSLPHSRSSRPEWIQSARYTFLQSAPWTPIQECLNEACLAYDGLLEQLEALRETIRQIQKANGEIADAAESYEAIEGLCRDALNPAKSLKE
jgi:hypothetical protein